VRVEPAHPTKQHLLRVGMAMLLKHGYNDLGLQALLEAADTPKGSFYHHFRDKEDFALQEIDAYQAKVRSLLDATVGDPRTAPLRRVRAFFDGVKRAYAEEGYLGCFLGALGQEMSGANDLFRLKIQGCFETIAVSLERCLTEARERGDIPATSEPRVIADLIVHAWEGAALRSRLMRAGRPLETVIDLCLAAAHAM